MSSDPALIIGGSGAVGRETARMLRAASPDLPILIGGRDREKAQAVAAEIGHAEGVVVDLKDKDLGLGARSVGAVAILLNDDAQAALRFALRRRAPYLSISSNVQELGPEVAAFIHEPDAAPVVLGAEWLVGATTVPTLKFAEAFGRIDDITVGALIDEEDNVGPEAAADMERLAETFPAAFTRRDGRFVWRSGEEAKANFALVDGTKVEAAGFAAFDLLGLAAATDAPNVQFNLASGVSSSRRAGGAPSTEIIIALTGEDRAGAPRRTRHAVVHSRGEAALTSVGVSMLLERLMGLDGAEAPTAGLYFPYKLLDSQAYQVRLAESGGRIVDLDVTP